MNPIDALSILLVVLVPFNWVVAGYLVILNQHNPGIVTLKSRMLTQIVLAACATIAGFFGFAALTHLHLDPTLTTILLAVLLVGISIPATQWSWYYLRGNFR